MPWKLRGSAVRVLGDAAAIDELRSHFGAVPGALRLTTVVDVGPAGAATDARPADVTRLLPPGSRLAELPRTAFATLPVVVGHRSLPPSGTSQTVELELRTESDRSLVLVDRVVAAGGWTPTEDGVSEQRRAMRAELRRIAARDWHEIAAFAAPVAGMEDEDDVPRAALDGYMTDRSRRNREQFRVTRYPSGPNRHPGTAGAFQGRSSVLIGQQRDFEVVTAFVVAQVLAALGALRDIRDEAYAELRAYRAALASSARTEDLAGRSRRLAELEIDLSFAVEAYVPTRLLAATQPLQDVAEALLDVLDVPRSAQVTGTMLGRLAAANEAERVRLEAAARAGAERRRAVWQPIAAAAVPTTVVFGYFGANIAGPDADAGLFAGDNLVVWLVTFAVMLVLVGAGLVAAYGRGGADGG